MTPTALILGGLLLILFVAACVAALLDDRQWNRDHPLHREPPSRLDDLDRGEDPWTP